MICEKINKLNTQQAVRFSLKFQNILVLNKIKINFFYKFLLEFFKTEFYLNIRSLS